MKINQYAFCLAETQNYTDRSAYISDVATSSIWQDPTEGEIPEQRILELGEIWDACHRSPKEIAQAAGISMRGLGLRFAVPIPTVEDWGRGRCVPPMRTLLLLQEALGIFKPNVDFKK